jgi:very-short-patch-repair endonuclease
MDKKGQAKLQLQLKKWRDDLINLSRTNRLLYFRHTKTASLEIARPTSNAVAQRFAGPPSSNFWTFHFPPAPPKDPELPIPPPSPRAGELLVKDKTASELASGLRLLERKANQEFVDKGLWTLYLGLGSLDWIDPDDDKKVQSPLLLVPVSFSRESLQAPFRLGRTEDDAVLNPALAVKLLNDFGIELPALDDVTETDPAAVRETVAEAVRGQRRWSVRDRAVLTTFTFHKEAMYRDLLDNEETIAEHALVQMLALGPDSPNAAAFDFDEVPDDLLDEVVKPEDLVSVRDGDSSQRRCVLAARDGRSFVMDGPPGTGKSQTITNLIAELMATGRTVLFVSEKAAALEVVQKRLREASLDDFALELHSHKATRKAVAAELGRALALRPSARSRFDAQSSSKLAAARKSLSEYALAMNEVRQPLGRSLHDVLGRVAALTSLPQAPVPTSVTSGLRVEKFNDLLSQAEVLSRSWAPVERGEGFVWRELRDVSMSAARRNDLERRVRKASQALEGLKAVLHSLTDELRLRWGNSPSDATRMRELLELLDDRPAVPGSWLCAESLDAVETRIDELAALASRHDALVAHLSEELEDRWVELDVSWASRARTALEGGGQDVPPWAPAAEGSLEVLTKTLGLLRSAAERLTELAAEGRSLASALGTRVSRLSVQRVAELAELGALVGSPDLPEPAWLSPVIQAALDQAATVLGELLSDFRARQAALATVFTPAVLKLDLPALRARFAEVHRGLGKTRKGYRRDKAALAACTVSGKVTKEVIGRLEDAAAWADLAIRLQRAEEQHSVLLGGYYDTRDSADFGRIARAIDVARRALELAGDELNVAALQQQLGRGGSPDSAMVSSASRARALVEAWQRDLFHALGDPAATALCGLSIDASIEWCSRNADRVETLIEAKRHFDAVGDGQWPVESMTTLFTVAEEANRLRSEVDARSRDDVGLLGPDYVGLGTGWSAMRASVRWAREVRSLNDGALKPRTAEAALDSVASSADLSERLLDWEKAVHELLSAFTDARSDELAADLVANFDDALSLLSILGATVSDIEVWSLYSSALSFLQQSGLEAVTGFCVDNKVPSETVPGIVERAALEAWADSVIEADSERLSPVQASERDALVDRFRALDVALVEGAAARVINACADRRPTSLAGAAGIIQREAQKQRRHMPIRDLLSRAGAVAQQLKPCFMMSPLSVSQYLPASLEFDVVVFDEASQVLPSDAINCVYRGTQLIVAGDQKQLPPSNFFMSIGADDDDVYDEEGLEDFESVLDLCKGAGGLRTIPLLWHYRSQHEKLITYSNYRFYEGNLHTFPGAAHEAPDLGVEVIKVEGRYRRGAQRDNPVEAAKVVERVLFHLHHHPGLSLGVVTFSAAQEDAVVAELELQATRHPELGGLISDDRLRGFFVKNLENVQGDERDIIIFSVGYGPDEFGKFTVQMGPLNKAGGWRRLNVAITRARRRVEVVTSVLPGDFPADLRAPGVRHLRGYLDFGLRGVEALALDLSESLGDAESVFEEEVLRVVRGWGYEAIPQVGLAGYRIDIGVKDPRHAGRFVLGIECDGAMYHSSKVARDRDRLRQQVIEGLGWQVHRIWGISWFRDRAGQEARLRDAIEGAIKEEVAQMALASPPAPPEVVHDEVDFDAFPEWATEYVLARPTPPRTWIEMHDPNARPDIRRMVREVVSIEAPVHEDRLLRAVREAWGVGRAGHRIRTAFDEVVRELAHRGELERDVEGFLRRPSEAFQAVRIPTDDPETVRPVAAVPPEELDNAVYWLVHNAHSITPADLRLHAARLFGWARTGQDISAAIEDAVDRMIEQGYVAESNGNLELVEE